MAENIQNFGVTPALLEKGPFLIPRPSHFEKAGYVIMYWSILYRLYKEHMPLRLLIGNYYTEYFTGCAF